MFPNTVRIFTALLITAGLVVFGACSGKSKKASTPDTTQTKAAEVAAPTVEAPKRIILLVGDGMGVGQITGAAYTRGKPLSMMTMPHLGWMTTHEHEFVTTDSAASATALATGHKTHFNGVAVRPGTTAETETDPANHLETVIEIAERAGWKTGLVATSRVVHATPAAFTAHRASRDSYEAIARDYTTSGVDVMMGAGTKYFEHRSDGDDLLPAMEERGYAIARTPAEVERAAGEATKLMGLVHEKDMPFVTTGERAMSLGELTDAALRVLDRDNEEGFFLLVEGSLIDWCAHALDAECTMAETLELDGAVERALAYARERDDTLVVVTGDHETGGLVVVDPEYSDRYARIIGGEEEAAEMADFPEERPSDEVGAPPMEHFGLGSNSWEPATEPVERPAPWGMSGLGDARWTAFWGHMSTASRPYWTSDYRFSAAHTPAFVPLFAEGPAAARMASVRDNAEVGKTLKSLVAAAAASEEIEVPATPPDRDPKNIVLFLADGLGAQSLTAAHYVGGGLEMTKLPVQGIASTHATDRLVNDSAGSATAIAAGARTRQGAVGTVPGAGRLVAAVSVVERAESQGRATGIITTTPITHATPAAFYAHVPARDRTDDIVDDFVSFPDRVSGSDGIELAIGGGAEHFDDADRAALRKQGVGMFDTWPPQQASGRLLGLLSEGGLAEANIRAHDGDPSTPTLDEMTRFALERLAADPDGFFLVVEGGQIDWRLHGLRRDRTLIEEIAEFDRAIAAAVAFSHTQGDTLVVVTSDHDHTVSVLDNHYSFESGRCGATKRCGGPFELVGLPVDTSVPHGEGFDDAAVQGKWAPLEIYVQYAWPVQVAAGLVDIGAPHSANFVPVFARGPRSDRFGGYVEQHEIGRALHELVE